MHSDREERHSSMPALIAATVAVVGSVTILLMNFAPSDGAQGNGAGMITAAALSRAGAIALPTAPTAPPGSSPHARGRG